MCEGRVLAYAFPRSARGRTAWQNVYSICGACYCPRGEAGRGQLGAECALNMSDRFSGPSALGSHFGRPRPHILFHIMHIFICRGRRLVTASARTGAPTQQACHLAWSPEASRAEGAGEPTPFPKHTMKCAHGSTTEYHRSRAIRDNGEAP